MQFPSKACYTILAAMDLALSGGDRAVTREEIARRHGLSQAYLSQILLRMRRAGIVSSSPGRRGGYHLARRAGDLSLAELIAAVDDGCSIPACPSAEEGTCRKLPDCPLRPLWQDLGRAARDCLRSVTLSEHLSATLAPAGAAGEEGPVGAWALGENTRLQISLRRSTAAIVATDTEGRVTLMNRAAARLTGRQEEEALGHPLDDVLALGPHGDASQPWPDAAHSSPTVYSVVTKDGPGKAVLADVTPIHGGGLPLGRILRLQDLSERHQIEEEMLRVNRLEALGAVLADAVHGLNDLLTAVVGDVSIARTEIVGDGRVSEALIDAEAASLQAQALAQRCLTLLGQRHGDDGATALTPLVGEVAAFALSGSAARCDLDVAEDTRPVQADEAEVTQLLQNLLANADEAMPSGGPIGITVGNVALDAANTIGLEAGDYVRIIVTDRGEGVPEPLREQVFLPYFTTKPGHSGLGLASCQAVARRCRGAITCSALPGTGTAVSVYLPAAGCPAAVPSLPLPPVGRRRILVMDDAVAVRRVLRRMLERLGYEVVATAHGEEAIASYAQALSDGRPFDAVLLDIRVPGGLGGRDTFARLRQLHSDVRGLVVTGY
ncbi:MAG: Rrf2 family transcriptional regulator, partial [Anaerolineae bacterium]